MAKVTKTYTNFSGGIADFDRETLVPNAYAFGVSVDCRSDPQNLTILPRTIKESGSIVTDLPKWGDIIPTNLDTYIYGDSGNLYKRVDMGTTLPGSYTLLRKIAASHGNGLTYYAGDDYLYYTSDNSIGRYGPLSVSNPRFSDDFLGAQGGVPLNTFSLSLKSSLSQYASGADNADFSITSDLSISCQIKPTTLPAVGSSMTLVSKWDESGATRSYKLDLYAISGVFGDGSDGSLHIAADTVQGLVDATCTGTTGANTLNYASAATTFTVGKPIIIHQTLGTGEGTKQKNRITGLTGTTSGVITLESPLNTTYTTGAQVIQVPQYTSVTVDAGVTWSAKAWNGATGGLLVARSNGSIAINGTVSGTGLGLLGGAGVSSSSPATAGNGQGVGGGKGAHENGGGTTYGAPGGGGANGTVGTIGTADHPGLAGAPGVTTSTADLTTLRLGAGGGGGANDGDLAAANGGQGGAAIWLTGPTITINSTGQIVSNGAQGGTPGGEAGNGGGGAGGPILLEGQTITANTNRLVASGGLGGQGGASIGYAGGNGGFGIIHANFLNGFSGSSSSPTLSSNQDNSLVSTVSYQVRLSLSSDGTVVETLARNALIQTGVWQQVAVSWSASTSTATFYLNSDSIGSSTGTLTSINDNASAFMVGADTTLSGVGNFYNGLIDEVRLWSGVRTIDYLMFGANQQIAPNSDGLVAYYQFNNDYSDVTNSHTLTSHASPVFSIDVPFASPTTRQDIDLPIEGTTVPTGDTYDVPLAISEGVADRLVFTPLKDPQKSIAFNIAAKGAGDWTVTIHDSSNNVITAVTVKNASLHTGLFEFVFAAPWRVLANFTHDYHVHITSTALGGTVVSSTNNDLSTAQFNTYFNFLVNDVDFHPLARFLSFWVVGNERYIGKYEATLYEPNFIALEAGWKVRCFAYWNEFIVAGCWRGKTISDIDQGRIYFWDGIAPTYNYYVDIPEGGVNALFSSKGELNIFAGYQGYHMVYAYSFGNSAPAAKVKRIPKASNDTYVEIFPGAINMWKSLLRYGVAGNSNSTHIRKGVYTWGHENVKYPQILTYDFPISTGSLLGDLLRVGWVMPVGGRLLIGWQDNVSYGVDYVLDTNPPYPTARIEFMVEDGDNVWKEKRANTITAICYKLLTGQSVTLQYRLDDDTNWFVNPEPANTGWISNPDLPQVDDTLSRQLITGGDYHQIQIGLDLATATDKAPVVNGVVFESDSQESSQRV